MPKAVPLWSRLCTTRKYSIPPAVVASAYGGYARSSNNSGSRCLGAWASGGQRATSPREAQSGLGRPRVIGNDRANQLRCCMMAFQFKLPDQLLDPERSRLL